MIPQPLCLPDIYSFTSMKISKIESIRGLPQRWTGLLTRLLEKTSAGYTHIAFLHAMKALSLSILLCTPLSVVSVEESHRTVASCLLLDCHQIVTPWSHVLKSADFFETALALGLDLVSSHTKTLPLSHKVEGTKYICKQKT